MKKTWYTGSNSIDCSIQEIKDSLENPGKFFESVVSYMPGMTIVELMEQDSKHVIIKTNEGIMKRSDIMITIEKDRVVLEFDEEYQAGRMVTAKSHYFEEFLASENGLTHRIEISNLKAPGFLGFFYRSFGSSNIGNALLKSYKNYLETPEEK